MLLFAVVGLNAQVSADFSVSKKEGCGTLQVQFTDLSTSTAGSIVGWNWDLGGSASDLQNPGKIYNQAGTFTICLTVTDDNGNSAQICEQELITLYDLPIVEFVADINVGCIPLTSTFTSLSNSPNGDITNFIWGLGGSASVVQTSLPDPITSTYTQADQFTISLSVEDEKGCRNTLAKPDFISTSGILPIEIFSPDTVSCNIPHTANIQILNPEIGFNYSWDFGNGTVGSGTDVVGTFLDFGQYDVTVFVENLTAGCKDTFVFKNFIVVGLKLDFSISKMEACANQRIHFLDNNLIEGEEVLWDFGDGNTSSISNAFHEYTVPGCYYISLTKTVGDCVASLVSDTCVLIKPLPVGTLEFDKHGSCTLPATFEAKINSTDGMNYRFYAFEDSLISANFNSVASFTFKQEGIYPVEGWLKGSNNCWVKYYDTLYVGELFIDHTDGPEGCAPVEISNLNDFISSPYNIVDWQWEILSTPPMFFSGPNPSLTLFDSASYDINVIAVNDEGCRDSIHLENYISAGIIPQVDFSADPLFACVDSVVQFNSLSSSFANEFEWFFGDAGTSLLNNPIHEYIDTGMFDVSLIVGHNGCFSNIIKEEYIQILPPVSKFIFEVDCASNFVSFQNMSIGADFYLWDFGVSGTNADISNVENPTFQFPSPGIYQVRLTVVNNLTGCEDDFEIAVDLRGLGVSFQIDTVEGCLPLKFQLSGVGEDIAKWKWKAPGANITGDTNQTAYFKYRSRGVFPYIRLIAESTSGCLDTFIYSDSIKVHQPFARFEIEPSQFCPGETISLIDSSQSLFLPITYWNWVIGDTLIESDEQFPQFQLDTAGVFQVSLYVEDSFGCSHSTNLDSALFFFIPDPTFSSDTSQCPGFPILFEPDTFLADLIYDWDFGDGTSSQEASVEHIYQTEGSYTVCLTVSNGSNCDSTFCRPNYVEILSPLAQFQADTFYANCPPLLVQFENQSLDGVSYLWKFGDGSGISDLENPGHIYTEPGLYDVFLEAKVSDECRDTIMIMDYIRIEGPEGNFTMIIDSTCAPLKVEFFGTSLDDYDYIWDFGDGQIDSSLVRTTADTSSYFYFSKGTYLPKLILVDSDECLRSFSASDSIHVLESAGAFLNDDRTICRGESTILEATLIEPNSNIQYEWISDDPIPCPTCLEINVTPEFTTTYYFQTTSLNGCVFEDSIIVTVQEMPTVDFILSKDTTLCLRDTMFIHLETSVVNPIINWAAHHDIQCLQCDSIAVVPKENTIYSVTIVDSFNCIVKDSISIEVLDEFQPFTGDDQTICLGDSVIVSFPQLSAIQWPNLSIVICDTCLQTILIPNESSCLPVEGKNDIGCLIKDTMCITVRKPEEVNAGLDQVICIGESIMLEGEGFGEVVWSPSSVLSNPTDLITDATPVESTNFILSSKDGNCSLSDSIFIIVKLKAEINTIGDTICSDELALIQVSGDAEEYIWPPSWINASIDYLDESHAQIETQISASGTYPIVGYLSSCEPDTALVHVTVFDTVSFQVGEDILNYPNHPVKLKVEQLIGDYYTFDWMPSNLFDCPTCKEPKVTLDSSQQIFIQVTDTRSGCKALDSLMFRVLATCKADEFIFIPNIFTPNNDGNNDVWGLFSDAHQEIDQIQVFDRWGGLVWSTSNFSDQWDGRLQNEYLPPGVYTYSVTGPCLIDDSDFVLKGTVTLIR